MVQNISNFTTYDLLRTFFLLRNPVSRSKLINLLGFGEGTLRSVLDNLKERGLIESSRKGHLLSAAGNREYAELLDCISVPTEVQLKQFRQYYCTAIAVRKFDASKKVSYQLRDTAIKNGAEAALIFQFRDGLKLLDADYKGAFDTLERKFQLNQRELLIVTCAPSKRWSEISSLAVASQLNQRVRRFCS